jgi:hypothetical protein
MADQAKESLALLLAELLRMLATVSGALAEAAAAGLAGEILTALERRIASLEETVLSVGISAARGVTAPQPAGRHLRSC